MGQIAEKLLLVLKWKSNIVISTGLTKKHISGNPHQISNSKGWYRNVPFGGNIYNRC